MCGDHGVILSEILLKLREYPMFRSRVDLLDRYTLVRKSNSKMDTLCHTMPRIAHYSAVCRSSTLCRKIVPASGRKPKMTFPWRMRSSRPFSFDARRTMPKYPNTRYHRVSYIGTTSTFNTVGTTRIVHVLQYGTYRYSTTGNVIGT